MPAVAFDAVDIVFGDQPQKALPLLDQGLSRDQILAETGQVLGVAGCTLAVERGEICVLMGLSGSGKSTLLRAVNRLNTVVRGSVKVEDEGAAVDVATCDARDAAAPADAARRHGVPAVRAAALAHGGRERRPSASSCAACPRPSATASSMEKLALVHLEQWAGKFAHELSGGMQQRVGLARAFATDADILLMDEPFSALDPLIRDKLQDDLLELQQRLHKTIIFVSHDLDEALKIGNTIAIMEGGRIIQAGPPEEIVTSPATDYVRNFVANVNPLNVLKLGTLMRPTEALKRDGDADRAGFADPPDGDARPGRCRGLGRRCRPAAAARCARSSRSSTAQCHATGCWSRRPRRRCARRSRRCATAAGRCWCRREQPAAWHRGHRRAARGSASSAKLIRANQ